MAAPHFFWNIWLCGRSWGRNMRYFVGGLFSATYPYSSTRQALRKAQRREDCTESHYQVSSRILTEQTLDELHGDVTFSSGDFLSRTHSEASNLSCSCNNHKTYIIRTSSSLITIVDNGRQVPPQSHVRPLLRPRNPPNRPSQYLQLNAHHLAHLRRKPLRPHPKLSR